MYQSEQATIPVADPQAFDAVQGAIDQSFSSNKVSEFLRSLEKRKLRIRDFEDVLKAGKLGANAAAGYEKLGDGDQGMIREHYLACLEKVPLELRDKHFKLYAYY